MPYKLAGKKVMVEKSGKWQVLKQHRTLGKAKAHLKALYANVPDAKQK